MKTDTTMNTNIKRTALLLLAFTLTGCGLTQSVSDGTKSVAKAIFYKQVKTLHLDFAARDGLNQDEDGMSLATDVTVYQLKDRQTFDKADYTALQGNAADLLKGDLLAEKTVWVRPGSAVSLDMPMDENAQYVAIVAQFRSPDIQHNTWRLVLTRADLDPDKPRIIEPENNTLVLKPVKDN